MNKTDNEIIRALDKCKMVVRNLGCNKCPYYEDYHCLLYMKADVLALINRQKEEIDITINIMNRQNDEIWQLKEEIEKLKNEQKPNEGKWIESHSYDTWHYDCPFCDDGYATKGRDTTPPNFCGNCGAKLNGVKCEESNND